MSEYNPQKIEKKIRSYWDSKDIIKKFRSKGKRPFYYLDGPPYTSGRIHIGHAWGRALRDAYLRYKRMAGFNVWDRPGFDMHGLPTALKVMGKFGLKTKEDIIEFGLSKFMDECRKFSIENMNYMIEDFKRIGIVMDWDNPYTPIKDEFIEGVWWGIKKANENGYLYRGENVMNWCASDSTALAKHELEYKTKTDLSIYVKLKVIGKEEYIIIWTTTPWTLPFNTAVMVNPEVNYVRAKVDGEMWILAEELVENVAKKAGKSFKITQKLKGRKLEGLKYEHPFPEVEKNRNPKGKEHTILLSKDYVDTKSGTGIVHCATGCGPEDYEVGMKHGIKPFNELDERGVFKKTMGKYSGLKAKIDDEVFVKDLEDNGLIVAKEKYTHEYPVCWRCKNPIVFRTTKQWFFAVSKIRDKLRKLNKKVKWVPGWAGANQFDNWLNELKDSVISRQRFWGTPLPVWKCNSCKEYEVIGSVEELVKKAGKRPKSLHMPDVDKAKWKCSCGGERIREKDIMDVWIDAGCVSWTCLDFPHRKDLINKYFPATFILEGKDQIRGWFNLLLIMSYVAMGKHSYQSVYMSGFVNDSQGRKMSKSLGNIISPYEVIEKWGADALRFYTTGSTSPGEDMNYNFNDLESKYKSLNVLINIHEYLLRFCELYKINPAKIKIADVKKDFQVEEKYMLSRLNNTIKKVTEKYNGILINEVPLLIEELFLDLSRWYIKGVRNKLVTGDKKEKEVVIYTIYNFLLETLKMISTVTPFLAEDLYLKLKNSFSLKEESIQLFDWPKFDSNFIDNKLENEVKLTNQVISAVLNGRDRAGLGVRWPIANAIVVTSKKNQQIIKRNLDIIMENTNLKKVEFSEKYPKNVKVRVKMNYGNLSRFKQDIAKIFKKLNSMDGKKINAEIREKGEISLNIGKIVKLNRDDLKFEIETPKGTAASEFGSNLVYLDTKLTPQLEEEGYARELVRKIQDSRKELKMKRNQRAKVKLDSSEKLRKMAEKHLEYIEKTTNSRVQFLKNSGKQLKIKEEKFTLSVSI